MVGEEGRGGKRGWGREGGGGGEGREGMGEGEERGRGGQKCPCAGFLGVASPPHWAILSLIKPY